MAVQSKKFSSQPIAPDFAAAAETMASASQEAQEAVEKVVEQATSNASEAAAAFAGPLQTVQENIRQASEKGLSGTREAYERLKVNAEEVTESLQASYAAARKGVVELNSKAIDALHTNTTATFEFWKSLVGVKSMSDVVTLNSEHARKQFEAISTQTRELSGLAEKIAADTVEPIKRTFQKSVNAAA